MTQDGPHSDITNAAASFSALTGVRKAAVLARIIHRQTIKGRAAHLETPPDMETLRKSNELIHRLAGHIVAVLARDTDVDHDLSIVWRAIVDGGLPASQAYGLDR